MALGIASFASAAKVVEDFGLDFLKESLEIGDVDAIDPDEQRGAIWNSCQ